MDVAGLAQRWRDTWERAWPAKDVEAITALYSADVTYRSIVFREPDEGVDGVRGYLQRNFEVEFDIDVRFGTPVAAGDRAACEWWACWHEAGADLTMGGVTVLRFNGEGLIVDHRDYWNEVPGRQPPFDGW